MKGTRSWNVTVELTVPQRHANHHSKGRAILNCPIKYDLLAKTELNWLSSPRCFARVELT